MSALLLSELLPLRTTRQLGDYAEDVILPEVFGDLRHAPFPLIRLSPTRYFGADHPMTFRTIYAARQVTLDWEQVLGSDSGGRTWTEIHFGAPVPQGTQIDGAGTGRLDDRTGGLIENPADVMRRITQLAGRGDDWSGIRAECSGLNLAFAGRISERLSVKAHLDRVAQSFGIIWNHGMARRYPTADAPAPIHDFYALSDADQLQVSASLIDTADVLRLAYDWSDASGRALHYIELSASPQRYGGLSKEVLYPYLRTPANAEAVGRPVLQRLAGDRYDVTLASKQTTIRPGDWIRPVAHPDWPLPGADPVIMTLSVEIDSDTDSIKLTGETVIGESTVTVSGHSIALPDTIEESVDIVIRNGFAILTFHESDGRPIRGGRVTIDGGSTLVTDAQGQVRYPADGLPHKGRFEAVGFLPFEFEVNF